MNNPQYHNHNELTVEEFSEIKDKALKARSLAYCPYSNFRVGCCLLTDSGFIQGANVENASYGAGICAERSAIVKAVSSGTRFFKAIAISGDGDDPISPCGICRQVIREFSDKELKLPVFMFNSDGSKWVKMPIGDLLPMSFGPQDLGM